MARLIFSLPHHHSYRITDRLPERLGFTVQGMVVSEMAAQSVAPRTCKVVAEYVAEQASISAAARKPLFPVQNPVKIWDVNAKLPPGSSMPCVVDYRLTPSQKQISTSSLVARRNNVPQLYEPITIDIDVNGRVKAPPIIQNMGGAYERWRPWSVIKTPQFWVKGVSFVFLGFGIYAEYQAEKRANPNQIFAEHLWNATLNTGANVAGWAPLGPLAFPIGMVHMVPDALPHFQNALQDVQNFSRNLREGETSGNIISIIRNAFRGAALMENAQLFGSVAIAQEATRPVVEWCERNSQWIKENPLSRLKLRNDGKPCANLLVPYLAKVAQERQTRQAQASAAPQRQPSDSASRTRVGISSPLTPINDLPSPLFVSPQSMLPGTLVTPLSPNPLMITAPLPSQPLDNRRVATDWHAKNWQQESAFAQQPSGSAPQPHAGIFFPVTAANDLPLPAFVSPHQPLPGLLGNPFSPTLPMATLPLSSQTLDRRVATDWQVRSWQPELGLLQDKAGNILFTDKDGTLRKVSEIKPERTFVIPKDGSIPQGITPPPSYAGGLKNQKWLKIVGAAGTGLTDWVIDATVGLSWTSFGISVAVLAVWQGVLYLHNRHERHKMERRHRNDARAKAQCAVVDLDINKANTKVDAAIVAVNNYLQERDPVKREQLRAVAEQAITEAKKVNGDCQQINDNRLNDPNAVMPSGSSHDHQVRLRARNYIGQAKGAFSRNASALLELHAQFALAAGDYPTAKQNAEQILSGNDNNQESKFMATRIWVEASDSQKDDKETILAKIAAAKEQFQDLKQQGILLSYQGFISKDVGIIAQAFNKLMQAPDADMELALLQRCFDTMYGQDEAQRFVYAELGDSRLDEKMALQTELTSLIKLQAETLASNRQALKQYEELEKQGKQLTEQQKEDRAAIVAENEQIESVVEKNAAAFRTDAVNLASQKERERLYQLGLAHLGADVAGELGVIKKLLTQLGRTKPQIEVEEPGVRAIISKSFALAQHVQAGRVKAKSTISTENLLGRFSNLSAEASTALKGILGEVAQGNTEKEGSKLFSDTATTGYLFLRVFESAVDLYLKSTYHSSIKNTDKKPLSYSEWLDESNTKKIFGIWLPNLLDVYSSLEMVTSFYQLVASGKANAPRIALALLKIFLQFPFLAKAIQALDEQSGEDAPSAIVFLSCFFRNISDSVLAKVVPHAPTAAKFGAAWLNDNGSSEWAKFAILHNELIADGLFVANCAIQLVKTYSSLSQEIETRKIRIYQFEMRERHQKIDSLRAGAAPQALAEQKAEASNFFRRIKVELNYFRHKSAELNKLRVEAIFYAHHYAGDSEVRPVKRDGNGFFSAVAFYTQEDPKQLRSMVVRYMKDNRGSFENFVRKNFEGYLADLEQDGSWADELVIRALSQVLKRPILVCFKDKGLDFQAQGLTSPNDFTDGDPIFVFYDQEELCYDSFLVRGEEYFEKQWRTKLLQKQNDLTNAIAQRPTRFGETPGRIFSPPVATQSPSVISVKQTCSMPALIY